MGASGFDSQELRERQEYSRGPTTEGLAVMRLLVLCALAIGAGILLFIGLLITAQELFSESIFGAPDESGEETRRRYADEERSTSSPSSSNPIG
jgi:hypothetical protein